MEEEGVDLVGDPRFYIGKLELGRLGVDPVGDATKYIENRGAQHTHL